MSVGGAGRIASAHVVENRLVDGEVRLAAQTEALAQGQSVSGYFAANSGAVAEALLAVTDGRAQKSEHGSVKGAYGKLRGSARKNVESAVPGLGQIIEKYT